MKNKIISNMLKLLFVGALTVSLAATVAVPATVQAEEMDEVVVADASEDADSDATVEEVTPSEEVDDEIPADMADETFIEDDFQYKIENGRAVTIKYNGSSSEVSIPLTAGGLSVDTVGAGTFTNNGSIEKVIIPEGIKTLQKTAFRNCTKLAEVIIKSDLSSPGGYAADGRWDRDLDNSIFFNAGASSGLKVIFEGNVKDIPSYLFATGQNKGSNKYTKITEIEIKAPVKNIGDSAFNNCYDLKKIIFNNELISIGSYAFSQATSLETVNFPDSVTAIGNHAFYN